jgi:hypothetical protein
VTIIATCTHSTYCDRVVGMTAGCAVFDEVPAMLTEIAALYDMDIRDPRSRARPSNSVLEILPNNAMALSEKDWLCSAKRA